MPTLRWAVEAELCAHLVAFWSTSAAAFVLYLSAFPGVDAPEVVRTAGGFLLGWAAGFIAVFAPQGAGVFETAVADTLHGAPLAALALVVGGYRAVTAVRDVLALLALAAVHSPRPPPGTRRSLTTAALMARSADGALGGVVAVGSCGAHRHCALVTVFDRGDHEAVRGGRASDR